MFDLKRNVFYRFKFNFPRYAYLVAVLVLFGAIYLVFMFQHDVGSFGVETDFYGLYAKDAQRILHGQMVQERDHGPGFAGLLAVLTLITSDVFESGKLLSFLSALGILITSYCLFSRLVSRKVSFWAVVMLGPVLLPYSFTANIDVVFAFFALLAILLFYKYISDRKEVWIILTGVASGIATLIRYNGLLLPAGILAIMAIQFVSERESARQKLRAAVIYLIFFAIPLIPWETFLLLEENSASSPGLNLALAWEYYGPAGRFDGDQRMSIANNEVNFQYDSFADYLKAQPLAFVKHYGKNLFSYSEQLLGAFYPFPASHLILAGSFFYFAFAEKYMISVLIFPLLAYLGTSLVHFYSRYFLFVVPFLSLLLATFFFNPFMESSRKKSWGFNWIWIFTIILVLLNTARVSYIKAESILSTEPRHLKSIAGQLKSIVRKDAVILSRKPHLAYLAGIRHEYFPPSGSIEDLIAYAKRSGAQYIEFGKIERNSRPDLWKMEYPDSVKDFLTPILVDSVNKEIIYKIK